MEKEIAEEMKKLPASWLGRNTALWTFMRLATLATLIGGAVCFGIFVLHNLIGGLWP